MKHLLLLLSVVMSFGLAAEAQDSPRLDRALSLPNKLFAALDKKCRAVEDKLTHATDRYLRKLQRQEEKLRRTIKRKNPVLARELFPNLDSSYQALRHSTGALSKYGSVYSSHLDSLQTALHFLESTSAVSAVKDKFSPALQQNLKSYQALQQRLNASEQIRSQLVKRQQQLKEQLSQLGMLQELKQFRKQVYYYQAQLQEYKALWEDPQKLEEKLLQVVRQVPAFKDFFREHSQLGQLFALPGGSRAGNGNASGSLAGLQTRASVNQSLVNRFGSSQQVTQALQQNVQAAQGQLNQLKQQLSKYATGSYGNSRQDPELPNFTPNQEKTRSLRARLELGFNVQSQKARYSFPAMSDLGLSLGYKLHQNAVIGIGLSYKLGLGRGWDHIQLTHQGIGLRSYLDVKLKGSLYISGGYERNYLSQIQHIQQLKEESSWQQSGLIGLSKRYKAGGKLKGEMKLLWDVLSYQNRPQSQPVVFRIGYSLK